MFIHVSGAGYRCHGQRLLFPSNCLRECDTEQLTFPPSSGQLPSAAPDVAVITRSFHFLNIFPHPQADHRGRKTVPCVTPSASAFSTGFPNHPFHMVLSINHLHETSSTLHHTPSHQLSFLCTLSSDIGPRLPFSSADV